MSMVSKEPCRFDTGCWRPLCWAALWSLLAKQEEEEDDLEVVKVIPAEDGSEHFVEQNADVPVPSVVAVVEITPEEHISERTQIVDIPVPQMLEELQERILERVDQIVDVQCLSINQVTKHAVFPHVQYIDKVIAAMPVVIQRQAVTIAHTGDQAR